MEAGGAGRRAKPVTTELYVLTPQPSKLSLFPHFSPPRAAPAWFWRRAAGSGGEQAGSEAYGTRYPFLRVGGGRARSREAPRGQSPWFLAPRHGLRRHGACQLVYGGGKMGKMGKSFGYLS